jgi:glycosyltransferase involved in cell wall biosynthesis
MKIAIVVSHPIQHFCPMYASWAKNNNVQLKVFFASNLGVQPYEDENFARQIEWGNLYLNEFEHEFLNGVETLQINTNLDAPNLNVKLLDFSPDLIIQYGRIYKFNKRLRNWIKTTNIKSAYISDSENRHSHSFLKLLFKKLFFSFYFNKFDLFLTVGDANENFYRSCGVPESKMLRMNFSIDIKNYDKCYGMKEFLRLQFRDSLQIEEDDLVLSVVGKLVTWKNQIDLISLLLRLDKDQFWPKIHLLIAGSGPCEEELRIKSDELENNIVHYLNFVDPNDLPQIYAASDVYVHPSSFEPHSLAISEAIYMGLPILVSDTSGSYGLTDDVRNCQNGLVFKVGDIADMEKKLYNLKELKVRRQYGEISKKIADDNQYQAHFNILNELIVFFANEQENRVY